MESKNIKVIDEHGIDRNANIIFSMDVDGSDYAVYWIERDSENDNIFVSKLIKNLDNTSNMINIEDTMEKGKIVEIVKELIKYSIDNENDKLSTNSVVLPSGKNVSFSSVIINKEQNINVQKTYITTVKKSVVKVTSEYYDVKVNEPVVSENVPEIFPVTGTTSVLSNEPEIHSVSPVIEPIPVEIPKVVEPVVVSATPEMVSPMPTPVVAEPVVPVIPVEVASNTVQSAVVSPIQEPVLPEVTPVVSSAIQPEVVPVVPVVEPSVVASTPEVVAPVAPVVSTPSPAPVVAEPIAPVVPEPVAVVEEPKDNTLVFDASNETNLNVALGEVSKESTLPVEDVSVIREFGEETPKVEPSVVATPDVVNNTTVVDPENVSKAGFANNKFFMFIAIAFFLASCVFLGYEVFNYFQIK